MLKTCDIQTLWLNWKAISITKNTDEWFILSMECWYIRYILSIYCMFVVYPKFHTFIPNNLDIHLVNNKKLWRAFVIWYILYIKLLSWNDIKLRHIPFDRTIKWKYKLIISIELDRLRNLRYFHRENAFHLYFFDKMIWISYCSNETDVKVFWASANHDELLIMSCLN